MQLRAIEIDAREREWIPLLDHGDDHRGDVCYDEKLHLADLKWAEENDAYLLLKGDKFNATTPDDRRYEHRNMAPQYAMLDTSTAIKFMLKDHVALYKPFAERRRILGCIMGNHEKTLNTRHHINMHEDFLDMIDEDSGWQKRGYHRLDLGYRAMLVLKFRVTKTRILPFVIWAWHGNGYPNEDTTRMLRLRKISKNYQGVNYFTVGHWHDRNFWKRSADISVTRRGIPRLQAHTTYYGMSGTYLKGMMEGHDGYPDKMAYPACELGGLRLLINSRTLEMKEA